MEQQADAQARRESNASCKEAAADFLYCFLKFLLFFGLVSFPSPLWNKAKTGSDVETFPSSDFGIRKVRLLMCQYGNEFSAALRYLRLSFPLLSAAFRRFQLPPAMLVSFPQSPTPSETV